jgi:hypothetical protein
MYLSFVLKLLTTWKLVMYPFNDLSDFLIGCFGTSCRWHNCLRDRSLR